MKRVIFYFVFFASISLNIYLFIRINGYRKPMNEMNRLVIAKDISHKEGFEKFKERFDNDEALSLKVKTNLIYFWDSLSFDVRFKIGMRELDSLATIKGKNNFNYIFATEMDEVLAKKFLARKSMVFSNFVVMGGMDDFISGVYNEKPSPLDGYFINGKKIKEPENNSKRKGYYFLMDADGRILYYNYRFSYPIQDKKFMEKLDSFPSNNKIIL